MIYKKIINSLDNTPNQPSKFKTKDGVKAHGEWRGKYITNSQIKLQVYVITVMHTYLLRKLYLL